MIEDEIEILTPTVGLSPFDGSVEPITPVKEMELVMSENFDAVYLIKDGTRRVFLNEAIYYTWFDQQTEIKSVTDATLVTIPLGAPMLPKPSNRLVKITSINTVYQIEDNGENGKLVALNDEEQAAELFGDDWATTVMDIDVTLFVRFER
ncbi:hypothetical protein HOI83_01935 [Candidatus Uhrbacteria bacterium]|jgi:hypothetical protein|nr:hypothetical protein [Candidatus Uhrbacteria bacterium]